MFWKDTIERVIRTTVQVVAGVVLAQVIDAGTFADIDWSLTGQAALYTAIVCVLMALAGRPIGQPDSPSVLKPPE